MFFLKSITVKQDGFFNHNLANLRCNIGILTDSLSRVSFKFFLKCKLHRIANINRYRTTLPEKRERIVALWSSGVKQTQIASRSCWIVATNGFQYILWASEVSNLPCNVAAKVSKFVIKRTSVLTACKSNLSLIVSKQEPV